MFLVKYLYNKSDCHYHCHAHANCPWSYWFCMHAAAIRFDLHAISGHTEEVHIIHVWLPVACKFYMSGPPLHCKVSSVRNTWDITWQNLEKKTQQKLWDSTEVLMPGKGYHPPQTLTTPTVWVRKIWRKKSRYEVMSLGRVINKT